MKQQQGIALITALLVLAALLVLGTASLTLTDANVKNTENLMTTTDARSNANTGLEATLLVLKEHVELHGQFPAEGTLGAPPLVVGVDAFNGNYRIRNYEVTGSAGASQKFKLQVEGTSAGSPARHIAEANGGITITNVPGGGIGIPQFYPGIYAGTGLVSGNEITLIDSGLHAGTSLNFTGSGIRAYNCEERNEAGKCLTPLPDHQDPNVPVTAREGATCRYNVGSGAAQVNICKDGFVAPAHTTRNDPGTDPITGEPLYPANALALRSQMLCEIAKNGECDAAQASHYDSYASLRNQYGNTAAGRDPCGATPSCFVISSSPANVTSAATFNNMFGGTRPPPGSTIYIRPGVTISGSNHDWSGYTIINDGTINVWSGNDNSFAGSTLITNQNLALNGTWDYTKATIVTEKGFTSNQHLTLNESTIISVNRQVTLSNGINAVDSLIYSHESLSSHGAASITGETTFVTNGNMSLNNPTAVSLDGESRAAFIAGGNITFCCGVNGHVNMLANGSISSNNPFTIYGGIVAHGSVQMSGRSVLDSGVNINNRYLPGPRGHTHTSELVIHNRR